MDKREQSMKMRAEGMTLRQIVAHLGITRQRAHQLLTTTTKTTRRLCSFCGNPANNTICSKCKTHRRCKPCDCGCGKLVAINWRYTQKCLARVLLELSK